MPVRESPPRLRQYPATSQHTESSWLSCNLPITWKRKRKMIHDERSQSATDANPPTPYVTFSSEKQRFSIYIYCSIRIRTRLQMKQEDKSFLLSSQNPLAVTRSCSSFFRTSPTVRSNSPAIALCLPGGSLANVSQRSPSTTDFTGT